MSGLQYSNYGDEDETPVKRKVPTNQPTQPGGGNKTDSTKTNIKDESANITFQAAD